MCCKWTEPRHMKQLRETIDVYGVWSWTEGVSGFGSLHMTGYM